MIFINELYGRSANVYFRKCICRKKTKFFSYSKSAFLILCKMYFSSLVICISLGWVKSQKRFTKLSPFLIPHLPLSKSKRRNEETKWSQTLQFLVTDFTLENAQWSCLGLNWEKGKRRDWRRKTSVSLVTMGKNGGKWLRMLENGEIAS